MLWSLLCITLPCIRTRLAVNKNLYQILHNFWNDLDTYCTCSVATSAQVSQAKGPFTGIHLTFFHGCRNVQRLFVIRQRSLKNGFIFQVPNQPLVYVSFVRTWNKPQATVFQRCIVQCYPKSDQRFRTRVQERGVLVWDDLKKKKITLYAKLLQLC